VIIIPFVIILLILKELINRGYVRLTGHLTVIALWVVFTGAMLFGADYNNPAFMGYMIVVICAGLLLSWRAALGWGIFSIITSAVILRLGELGILPPTSSQTPAFAFWTAQSMYILTATVLLGLALLKIDEARANAQREIKEREKAEAEREKVIKELEAKNAELERFTYTVSHDLKAPLFTIGGFLGFLEEDVASGNMAKFKKDLERIREAKDKMHVLLNELLELSRVGRLMSPTTDTPFGEIVEDALALTRGRLMDARIRVEVSEGLPIVNGDRPRLVEVMQNLIDNSAKFMGDQSDPCIRIGAQERNGEFVFFVGDNGIGIDPVFHDKVFGLFDKLNPKSEGTGVGLALVKRIIEIHGGRIWIESNGNGQGSMFCFTLPVK
jgi:signal transduction histidine kinase